MTDKYVEYFKNVETGCITDAMNLAGVHVGWMEGIYPTHPEMRLCGRAFTVQYETVRNPEQKKYSMYDIFDMCQPGDIVVVASYNPRAMVGDNMMMALKNKKLGGMVLDGRTRDSLAIAKLGIPQFTAGRAIGVANHDFKITAFNVPIMCGHVRVEPGDYVIGDCDGVIALAACNVEQVKYQCEKAVEYEEKLDVALKNNVSMSEFSAIYQEKNTPRALQ